MELAKYKACICEGSAESAIMDILLDHDLLIFNREEMLIIFNEDKYKEFKKSGKKPSSFCKEDLKMAEVKSYDFVKSYFSNPMVLVSAIKNIMKSQKFKRVNLHCWICCDRRIAKDNSYLAVGINELKDAADVEKEIKKFVPRNLNYNVLNFIYDEIYGNMQEKNFRRL